MAIDHRINLEGISSIPQASQAINIFENALMNSQTRDLRQAQEQRAAELQPFNLAQAGQKQAINDQVIAQNEAQAGQDRRSQYLQSINDFAMGNASIIQNAAQTNDPTQLRAALVQRKAQLQQQGMPTETTDDGIAMLDAGNVQGVISSLRDGVNLYNQSSGAQKKFALQSNAPITDPNTGQVSTPVFDPSTGQTRLVPIEGAIQETPTQAASREQRANQAAADLDVETTKRKERVKKTEGRASELKSQYSTQRRQAANSTRKIKEAQKLSEKATQGLKGASLVQLGRVFPGIDVSDEAALTGAFKSLALDELQKFKGPTTDFEFRVTEDIAGSLGDGAAANKARLASLERAAWFAGEEAKQFSDHQKAGHDPDEFFFNINKLVTPKKGGKSYSLQSLQDTAVANHISIDEVIKRLSK